MAIKCPANCGKKFISMVTAAAHANQAHPGWDIPKRKGWATPHGFVDFKEPVTYEHACGFAEAMHHEMTVRR